MQETEYQCKCIYESNIKNIRVDVPGSKSITNRALLLAALAEGTTRLGGVLFSGDSRHLLECLKTLGIETSVDEAEHEVVITGCCGRIPVKKAKLYVGSAGTAARFLTAVLACTDGEYEMDASEQMRKRPMAPLLAALDGLGCEIRFLEEEGHFPFVLKGHKSRMTGGKQGSPFQAAVNIDHSSQFLSALMMAGVLLPNGLEVLIQGGRKAMSYVEITAAVMNVFGIKAVRQEENRYFIPGMGTEPPYSVYQAADYYIEPDLSSACYFYAMAPILHTRVMVNHIYGTSIQGDKRFLEVLERLGCTVTENQDGIEVDASGLREYPGIEVDMQDFSDQSMTMAALAVFAASATEISGIGHIRYQESDRIHAMAAELKRLGILCEEKESGLKIFPGQIQPASVETYEDHRMAMAFSLIGLRVEGIRIQNPGCTAKTFENYFQLLDQMVQEAEENGRKQMECVNGAASVNMGEYSGKDIS